MGAFAELVQVHSPLFVAVCSNRGELSQTNFFLSKLELFLATTNNGRYSF